MKTPNSRKKGAAKKAKSKRSKKQVIEQETQAFSQVTDPAVISQILSMFGSVGPGNFRLPRGTNWVDLYTKPVPANWGPNRLHRLLSEECRIEIEGRAFLFFNRAQNHLRLYFRDVDGDQMMVKVLDRGGFIFPVADATQDFIKVSSKKLASLFRS